MLNKLLNIFFNSSKRISHTLTLYAAAAAFPVSLIVCPNCELKSIKEALKKIAPSGTIIIKPGIYKEGRIIIEKPVTLQGEEGAIIDGESQHQPLTISKTNNVSIKNLKIQNSGTSFLEEIAGIKVIESKDCQITGNTIFNATYGIYLEKSEHCTITNNTLQSFAVEEANSGNGIHIWTGADHVIENNTIAGHRDGIYLEFAKAGQIRNNFVKKNIRYGLHFMSSNDAIYEKNTFTENGAGVAVMYSRRITMLSNKFIGNTGPSAYGLLLKDIVESKIENNEFTHNTVGIYMEGSNRSQFTHNEISSNGLALKIMGDCENNNFYENNFIGNTFDVATNSHHSWNNFNNNYWSQYEGYDFDSDGKGDKVYRPISLSSIILERVDSSYILLNSFFFRLIDEVERALPEMIPEQLKDEAPLMKSVVRLATDSEFPIETSKDSTQ